MSTGLTPTEFSSAVTAITSAFGDPTRREIYLFAHERSDRRTAERRHRRRGRRALRPPPQRRPPPPRQAGRRGLRGGRHRPHVHRRGPAVEALPGQLARDEPRAPRAPRRPARHAPRARRSRRCPTPRPRRWPRRSGIEYGKAMAAAMGGPAKDQLAAGGPAAQRSFRTALHAVADALTAHGFAAHAERHRDGLRIVSEHCPFGGAAIEHPVICAVDRGLVRGHARRALRRDRRGHQSSSLPMGDDHCVTSVTVVDARPTACRGTTSTTPRPRRRGRRSSRR